MPGLLGLLDLLGLLSPSLAQETLFTLPGQGSQGLGTSLAACDVNCDGFADLIVGAPFDGNHGGNAGAVFVYSGLDRAVLHAFSGLAAGDHFGWSVSAAGDVNGDGHPDVIAGAPQSGPAAGTGRGYVRVFSGKDGSLLFDIAGRVGSDYDELWFGFAVSGEDLDGDGLSELIIGAPRSTVIRGPGTLPCAGSVRILAGTDGSTLRMLRGSFAEENFGFSVSGAGDLDRDGLADIVVGAPSYLCAVRGNGSVLAYCGRDGALLRHWQGATGAQLGWAVRAAGDIDGDGYADILAGSPSKYFNAGYFEFLSGFDATSILGRIFIPSASPDSSFGRAISRAADVNGDGYPDVVVGDPEEERPRAGRVRVISGRDGAVLLQLFGQANADNLGFAVALADVNSDGYPDVIQGAPQGARIAGATAGDGYVRVTSLVPTGVRIESRICVVKAKLRLAGERDRLQLQGRYHDPRGTLDLAGREIRLQLGTSAAPGMYWQRSVAPGSLDGRSARITYRDENLSLTFDTTRRTFKIAARDVTIPTIPTPGEVVRFSIAVGAFRGSQDLPTERPYSLRRDGLLSEGFFPTKVIIKTGKRPAKGSYLVQGYFMNPAGFDTLASNPLDVLIPGVAHDVLAPGSMTSTDGRRFTFQGERGNSPGISQARFDTTSGAFEIRGQNLDLAALGCRTAVTLEIEVDGHRARAERLPVKGRVSKGFRYP